MKKIILPLLLFMLTILSETEAQMPSPSSVIKSTIVFGSGGGIKGKLIRYTLQEDGKVLMKDGLLNDEKELKTIPQEKTDAIFEEVKTFFTKNENFKKPGNMYLFIKLNERAKTGEMSWSTGAKSKPPVGCKSLFVKLITLVE